MHPGLYSNLFFQQIRAKPQFQLQFQFGIGESIVSMVVLGTSYLIIVTSLIWTLKLTQSSTNTLDENGCLQDIQMFRLFQSTCGQARNLYLYYLCPLPTNISINFQHLCKGCKVRLSPSESCESKRYFIFVKR